MIPTGLSFATPWLGAAALLGVPVTLAIHFLQLPARPQAVSTLFLLETLAPESTGGRRFQQLRQSVPLWLQLLAVALLAWLLAGPRWVKGDSSQTILVLLDSSISMQAFRDQVEMRLPPRLGSLASTTQSTRWIVMETNPAAKRVYAGDSLTDLAATLPQWQPRLGMHDPRPALRTALALAGEQGGVIFVTDHVAPVPEGVALLAVGSPVENAGFAGLTTQADGWEALLRHYGSTPQTRRWRIEPGGTWESVSLNPGELLTLRGRYPGEQATLVLDPPDPFPLDDRLPLQRPHPRTLKVRVSGDGGADPRQSAWLEAFFRSVPGLERVSDGGPAHLTIAFYDPLAPALPAGEGAVNLLFAPTPAGSGKLLTGPIVAENDPLLEGLSWDGLLAADGIAFPRLAEDQALLWQGGRSLIFRRNRQLFIGFDPVHSNATRLPAFVVLLHRYVESVREATPLPEAGNFETHQLIGRSARSEPPAWRLRQEPSGEVTTPGRFLRAPELPGFFTLSDGAGPLVTGAAHFADPREADFREAASDDTIGTLSARQQERHSEADALTPLWLLLLGVVMVLNWRWKQ